ncbi:MAG: hypothetical protein ACNA77_11000 [Opitutales bacterium]
MNRFRKQYTPKKDQSDCAKPLRRFNNTSQGSRNSRAKRRSKGKFVYWLLLVCLLTGALAGLRVFYSKGSVKQMALGEGPVPFSRQPSLVKVSDILNAYLNSLGGYQALQDVRSVRYEGKVHFPSGEKDFQIWLLAPDKGMLVTDPGSAGAQRLIVNGDVAWLVLEDQDGARKTLQLDQIGKESLKWSLRVHHSLRQIALVGETAGIKVKSVEYKDKPCYELTKVMPDGSELLAILDKDSLYLLKMVETIRLGDGQEEFTVLYDDYRMVSGVVEPYVTTLYKNGEFGNRVEVRSIQINSGVMSSIFEVPEDLKESQDLSSSR